MSSVRSNLLATAATAIAMCAAAQAADMPAPVIYQPVAVPVQEFGGWYLRGDIGMSNQKLKNLDYFRFSQAQSFSWLDEGGFDSAPFFGLGIGYQYNNWLRFDLTGEYRGKASFHALDRYFDPALNGGAGAFATNDYRATKSEWLFLANAYIDLGTWWCITPFIGAGVGVASITIDHFRDTNVIAGGGGYADSGTSTNFAWAAHAGLAYKVNPNFTIELAYRYLSMGDGKTGTAFNLTGTTSGQAFTFNNITSHDLKFGVRWALQDSTPGAKPAFYAPPPVSKSYYTPPQQVITTPPAPVYQPQPQYAPPPAYQDQPPLMRRG
jgi:opacity protein-like surface antigen